MAHTPTHAERNAYTLLELAIVIVVIGLIMGAVMGGKNMIHQSELQSVTVEFSNYTAAVHKFQQQYGSIPGDILDATTFWNSAGGTGLISNAACRTGLGTGTAYLSSTCNGDNDGLIATQDEPYLAWQHLMLAKLVKGSFTGLSSSGGSNVSVLAPATGGNVPTSKLKNSGWTFNNVDASAGNSDYYSERIGNHLTFGQATTGITDGPSLTPEEAYQIDAKLDDGKPAYGRVLAHKPSVTYPNCSSSSTDASAAYNFPTYKSTACSLMLSLTLK